MCTLIFVGCLKQEEFPDTPVLKSGAMTLLGDSARLQLSFTDGDGNFGLEQADTTGDFALCGNRYNLFIEYYEKVNGVWEWQPLDPCDDPAPDPDVPFYFKVPWAKPTGQNPTQQGMIGVAINFWYLPSDQDTVKYLVHIMDRDFQSSNTLELGPFVKP
jgi:hypothetical protein